MVKHKIVLVPFPFDDLSAIKVRPALCITNAIGKYKHIVIAFISSKIPEEILETDILLTKTATNFISTGLQVSSIIRVHKIVTIPQALIKRELGIINEQVQQQLATCINKLFS